MNEFICPRCGEKYYSGADYEYLPNKRCDHCGGTVVPSATHEFEFYRIMNHRVEKRRANRIEAERRQRRENMLLIAAAVLLLLVSLPAWIMVMR